MNKFLKSIGSIILGLVSRKNDLEKIEQVFTKIDSNNDGFITADEIRKAENELKENMSVLNEK